MPLQPPPKPQRKGRVSFLLLLLLLHPAPSREHAGSVYRRSVYKAIKAQKNQRRETFAAPRETPGRRFRSRSEGVRCAGGGETSRACPGSPFAVFLILSRGPFIVIIVVPAVVS